MSLPFSLGFLLLPLLGGYLFLKIFNVTRFYFRSVEGQALFFASASIGVVLLALSQISVVEMWGTETGDALRSHLKHYAPFPHSGAAIGALILGVIGAGILDIFIWPTKANNLIARWRNDLLDLLIEVQAEKASVLLTLESGKAYVGYILDISRLSLSNPYVKILPTISGYRTAEELHLELVTIYEESKGLVRRHYDGNAESGDDERLQRLQIVLRRTDIVSASFFNENLYRDHYELREKTAADEPDRTTGISFALALPGGKNLGVSFQR